MTTPVVALQVPAYANRSPYITVAEFLASPTGVDATQLVPGGSSPANTAALQTEIARASAWADSICYQVLAATIDVQPGRFLVKADGWLRVPVNCTPIVQVNSVTVGRTPSSMAALTDLADCWLGDKTVNVPVPFCGHVFAAVSYVNGYANTTLAADASAGATSIQVASAVGIVAGLPMTIYDGADTEAVVVADTWTPLAVDSPASVPLAAALQASHVGTTSVSALPSDIKRAVVSLTCALIKTRGAEAVSMSSIQMHPSTTDLIESGGITDVQVATDLLIDHRRIV